jgi:hypothetical protein
MAFNSSHLQRQGTFVIRRAGSSPLLSWPAR